MLSDLAVATECYSELRNATVGRKTEFRHFGMTFLKQMLPLAPHQRLGHDVRRVLIGLQEVFKLRQCGQFLRPEIARLVRLADFPVEKFCRPLRWSAPFLLRWAS